MKNWVLTKFIFICVCVYVNNWVKFSLLKFSYIYEKINKIWCSKIGLKF